MIVTGASVLWLMCEDMRSARNAEGLLLALWVIRNSFFAVFLNWTINSRSIMPMGARPRDLLADKSSARQKTLSP